MAADPTMLHKILSNCRQDGDCLLWKGGVSSQGAYPYLGRSLWAHREAYRAFHGDLEDGSILHESDSIEVHHRCNTGGDKSRRRCCNPLHMSSVTRRHHNQLHKGAN
jgi:hypothetical protein